ncbi:hypothetical protein ICM_04797 [Bacillus cereus BAG1X2-3]|nr:hypothetical protein ICC_04899 [Bacillus cereus BAG1X1-1]EOO43717.1 hypothetical protein ICI_05562 [Bacillus cereus BAG1X2-1]EOO45814.1 hypothetical protein ICK_05615 [Bacillus cereus BAG1X2-2]EOO62384.1 hypothetical protein ICM_04797 [Bacillus cereus BAG1X2-3]EOP00990.1 hypothetical protein ICO_05822 [Bacillus cereus BAG2O-1]
MTKQKFQGKDVELFTETSGKIVKTVQSHYLKLLVIHYVFVQTQKQAVAKTIFTA